MKSKVMNLIMLAAVFFTLSCSTKSDPAPNTVTAKFTINGNSYSQVSAADSATTVYGNNYNVLGVTGQSTDKTKTGGLVFFWLGSAKPKAGSYAVVYDVAKMTAGQVGILAVDKTSSVKSGIYSSAGTDGTSVTVAVNSSGKVSVTMPTIAIKGTLLDNTDPKNTVSTDVTGSISGTASE